MQVGPESLIAAAVACKSRPSNHLGVFTCNLLSLMEIDRPTGNVTVSSRCNSPAAIGAPSERDRSLPGCRRLFLEIHQLPAAVSLEHDVEDRQFTLATIVWGLIGMLAGLFVALEMVVPSLNLASPG